MDLFSMLGDIGGKPYNNMTISADMPSAFSGKTENENSDNLDDYLSVEEKSSCYRSVLFIFQMYMRGCAKS